jgi:hypothetical protein
MPRRARAIINKMLDSKVVTPQGVTWLVAATDPFHDEPLTPDGYPDVSTSRSITQCITLTQQVNTVGTGLTTWDAHIFLFPVTPSISYKPGNPPSTLFSRTIIDANGNYSTFSGPPLNAGFNIIRCAAGTDWSIDPSSASVAGVGIPLDYTNGYFRVIGCAFEVVNSTASLYKGGTVTAYKSPAYSMSCMLKNTNLTTPQQYLTDLVQMPPTTQSNAALFPDSRTWAAEEGCYVIETLNDSDLPFVANLPSRQAGMVYPVSNSVATSGSGPRIAYLPTLYSTSDFSPQNTTIPFDISGAVFAGLNQQSTLQVTVKYFIERIPGIADPNLLVLARNPCPYDPVIMEIYSRVMSELPVGVKVSMNPMGEWFYEVLKVLGAAAPALGLALAPVLGPAGPAIGGAVGGASTAALAHRAQQKASKQQTKPKG